MEILTDMGAYQGAVERFSAGLTEHVRKKLVEEIPQAAAFCAGMSQLWRRPVIFSPGERCGSDAVIAIGGDPEVAHLAYLQLKMQPELERSTVSLQELINRVARKNYSDPERFYVAIPVNRPGEIDFDALVPPPALKQQISELWIFGRLAGEDRTQWFFRGDLLEHPWTWPARIPDVLPL
jgi:hypothetical protein